MGVGLTLWAKIPTNFNRFVSGCAKMKSMMVPWSIHSEIIIRVCGDFFVPISSSKFGCLNCFHRTTSRQKFYHALVSVLYFGRAERERGLYLFQPIEIHLQVDPQNLDCNSGTLIRTTPHICVATSPIRTLSEPPQLVGYRVWGRQSFVLTTHLPEHHKKPFLVVGAQSRVVPRALVDIS